jgi:hypothetical protein
MYIVKWIPCSYYARCTCTNICFSQNTYSNILIFYTLPFNDNYSNRTDWKLLQNVRKSTEIFRRKVYGLLPICQCKSIYIVQCKLPKTLIDNNSNLKLHNTANLFLFLLQAMRKRDIVENESIPVPTLKDILNDVGL